MNKKELIKLLDKCEIEYEIIDNAKEVEEGLRLLDEALEKIGIIIPKETQVDNITRENDPEVPKYTTEWASSDDTISRQAAIEALTGWQTDPTDEEIVRTLKELPPVESKTDLVNRSDVLELAKSGVLISNDNYKKVCEAINGLPSCHTCRECEPKRPKTTETMMVDGEPTEIDPLSYEVGYTHGQFSDRPKGEWILECDAEGYGDNLYRCSECGQEYGCQEYDLANFCPNCGADMRGDKE